MFFKKSTRTRVSFQVGVHELGGLPVMLNADDLQLSRGETVADTAKVLSRYLHGMVIRCHEHALLEEFARCGTMPVVNALSDFLHPCQFMTDMFTLAERYAALDALRANPRVPAEMHAQIERERHRERCECHAPYTAAHPRCHYPGCSGPRLSRTTALEQT